MDRRLYLPEDWADDKDRRAKGHVPPKVKFQEKWQIALDLLDRSLPGLPHGWITHGISRPPLEVRAVA